MQLIKSDKSKPVEKQGRKAKGLQSHKDHDSLVAKDKNKTLIFTSLAATPGFFLEPYQSSFDKGKPVEKRGRKAKSLQSFIGS